MVSQKLASFALFALASVTIVRCDFFSNVGHHIERTYNDAKTEVGHWGESLEGAYHKAKEKVDNLLNDGVAETVKKGIHKVEEGTSDGMKYVADAFDATKHKLTEVTEDVKRRFK